MSLTILQFLVAAGAPLPIINAKTPNWSIYIKDASAIVTDEDEINQSIFLICTTALGSDPLRPEFGTDYFPCIDMPMNRAALALRARITRSLNTWEARIQVVLVEVSGDVEGHFKLTITWDYAINATGRPRTLSFVL